jgi:Domain of unknown function (DUF4091)
MGRIACLSKLLLASIVLMGCRHSFAQNRSVPQSTPSMASLAPLSWIAPSTSRIGLRDRPGTVLTADIAAARGESEGFQIGIRSGASAPLSNVNVEVSDLSGPNGAKISNADITLYREQFVKVDNPTKTPAGSANPSLGVNWYADGLIPFANPATKQPLSGNRLDAAPFSVSLGSNQVVWVDVYVPRNTPAGVYQGQYTVSSDQGNSLGEISLRVWDFELPLQPSLNSAFTFWQDGSVAAASELVRHRLMPGNTLQPRQEEALLKLGLNTTRLVFDGGADMNNPVLKPLPDLADLTADRDNRSSQALRYIYVADEVGDHPELFDGLKQWSRLADSVGLSTLVTMAPTPELFDNGNGKSAVDIWAVTPELYDKSPVNVRAALAKGDRVWSYNALAPDDYSPKWQIDFAPINFRIQPGFINQSLGISGLLYWRVDLWTSDPWNNVQTTLVDNLPFPGEGMLVYPGADVGIRGVVPSMRLKWLRDGVDDYDYIELLKKAGKPELALELSRQIGPDWRNWNRDPQELEKVRRRIGEELEKITLSEAGGRANLVDLDSEVDQPLSASMEVTSPDPELGPIGV